MLQFKTKLGSRGQIVIPKVIRDNLGMVEDNLLILEVEDKVVKIMPSGSEGIAERWRTIASREGGNVKKEFVYGDRLYEEESPR